MKEKPKKSVRMWVARDKDNKLYLYYSKPQKHIQSSNWLLYNDENIAYKESYLASRDIILLDPALFPSVKWEDKEPTRLTVRLA